MFFCPYLIPPQTLINFSVMLGSPYSYIAKHSIVILVRADNPMQPLAASWFSADTPIVEFCAAFIMHEDRSVVYGLVAHALIRDALAFAALPLYIALTKM